MTSGKGKVVGGLEVERTAVGSRQRHALAEVMVEVVVHLVVAVIAVGAEDVDVVAAGGRRAHDAGGALLVAVGLGFDEAQYAVGSAHGAAGVDHGERMLAPHDGVG